jgi:oligopeptide transport system substrate-binding protein
MVVVPDIARSWEISEDGLTYVFHLREDAKWSDGHLLTSADFVLAWRRVLDPNAYDFLAEQLYDIRGAQAYHLGKLSDENELGLRTPDDHTLIVELEHPASYFLHLLAAEFAQPVPQQRIAELGDNWADPEQVVTNGPFVVTSWSPGQAASLIRNPHYHGVYGGNVSRVEALIIDTIEGWEKAMTQYAQGDVDLLEVTRPPGNALSAERTQFGENYFNVPNWTTYGIAFNPTVSPVNDVHLRRALAMAIDRDQLVGALSIDQATPAHGGWIPYGLPGHSPGIGLPFDPLVARRLLAEAGLLDGNELSGLEMVWPDNQFNRKQGAFLAKLWLTHLGIAVRPVYLQYNEWLECINRDPPAMYFSGWTADYPDPDSFVRPGSGLGSKYNERFVEIIDAARATTDQRQRLTLYCQADKLLVEEALIIPITYGLGQYLVSSRVRRLPATLLWRDIIVDPD